MQFGQLIDEKYKITREIFSSKIMQKMRQED